MSMDVTVWGCVPIGGHEVVARYVVRTPKPPLGYIDYGQLLVALATHYRKRGRSRGPLVCGYVTYERSFEVAL